MAEVVRGWSHQMELWAEVARKRSLQVELWAADVPSAVAETCARRALGCTDAQMVWRRTVYGEECFYVLYK